MVKRDAVETTVRTMRQLASDVRVKRAFSSAERATLNSAANLVFRYLENLPENGTEQNPVL